MYTGLGMPNYLDYVLHLAYLGHYQEFQYNRWRCQMFTFVFVSSVYVNIKLR